MTATAPPPTARLWTRANAPAVAATLLLMTCIAFESYAITTALPTVVADLGGEEWYSAAFAGTLTASLVGTIIGGTWADRGRVTAPLAVGGALFLAGIVLCALAPDILVFVLGRLLQGLGGGIDSVLVYVVIARFIDERARPAMFGLVSAAWLLPSLLGPLIAGGLVEFLHWRLVFAFVAALAAVAIVMLLVSTRRDPTPPTDGRVLDRRALWAVVAAGAILGLHVGGVGGSPIAWLGIGVGVLLLVVAALRLLPAGTLSGRPGVPRLVGLRGLVGAVATATELYLALYLQSERQLSPTTAGLLIATGALGWAVGSWVQARFGCTRRDDVALIRAGTVLVLAGPAAMLVVIATSAPVAVSIVATVVMGIGLGIAFARISAATLGLTPPAAQGGASAALTASESMTVAAFLAVTGTVLAATAGTDRFLLTTALTALMAIAAVIAAWRHDPVCTDGEGADGEGTDVEGSDVEASNVEGSDVGS